ncbi:hypothetical protein G6F50_016026 [Rhizopus delemar]|uniref:Uncharacterized protein n=1 Tax=Rhizopus delemar TaxID=936053 RepID=A0A9P6XVD9_9FUNG|nr:hypothetical protein G6F50_016026 [Rhizopus delemar]
MADSGPALSAEASASLPSGSCWALSCPDGGFDAGLAAALGAGFRPSTTSSGDAAPLSRTAPRSMLAALSTNARSVLMVERCTSMPWMVEDSIDRFMRSQFSTERNSAMRRSRSSRFMGGAIGRLLARPPGPVRPAQAWRIISMLARRGLPDRSEFCPMPGRTNGFVNWSLMPGLPKYGWFPPAAGQPGSS